jgi:hypothetical protein
VLHKLVSDILSSAKRYNGLSVVFDPSAGEPTGQVLNSQAVFRGVGVVVDEPVPDWFSEGAERITCNSCALSSYRTLNVEF